MAVELFTKRLYLRELRPSDASDFYQLNADAEVLRYTGDLPFSNPEAAIEFLRNYDHYQRYGFGRWAVIDLTTEEFLGWCGLKYNEEKLVDLGFRLHRRHWNQGYATEAAQACVAYGFAELKLSQIIGRCHPENRASIRVLEKIGMKFWKTQTVEGIGTALYYQILP